MKNPLANNARKIVSERLAQLSRGVGKLQETYMFRDDKFQGIRFEQSVFHAIWKLDENEIRVFRNDQQILVLSASTSSNRRVA